MTKIKLNLGGKPPSYGTTVEVVVTEAKTDVKTGQSWRRESKLLAVFVLLYACFLVSGAAVFCILEAPGEQLLREELLIARREFIARFPSVPGWVVGALFVGALA